MAVLPKSPEDYNDQFNDLLRLIEMFLLDDVSELFPNIVEDYARQGGDVVVTRLTPRGQEMFERHKWLKWVN